MVGVRPQPGGAGCARPDRAGVAVGADGGCASPVTLGTPRRRPPDRAELLAEAQAPAELARRADPGGEVTQARFVLQWLAGEIEALPLWNGGPQKLHVTDGAVYPQTRAGIDEVYSWALLAEFRYPWRVGAGAGVSWRWPGPAPAGLDVSGGHGRCRGCQQVAVDGLDLVGERVQVTGGHRQHRVELCRHLDPQRLHTQLEISRITGEPGCLAGRDDPQPAGLAAQQDLLVDTAILGSEDHRDRICAMPLGRDDLGGAGGG